MNGGFYQFILKTILSVHHRQFYTNLHKNKSQWQKTRKSINHNIHMLPFFLPKHKYV